MRCEICGRKIKRKRGDRVIKVKDWIGRKRVVCSEACRETAEHLNFYFQKVLEELGEDWVFPYALLVDIHAQGKDYSCPSCTDFLAGICGGNGPGILECMYRELKEMKRRGLRPEDIIEFGSF